MATNQERRKGSKEDKGTSGASKEAKESRQSMPVRSKTSVLSFEGVELKNRRTKTTGRRCRREGPHIAHVCSCAFLRQNFPFLPIQSSHETRFPNALSSSFLDAASRPSPPFVTLHTHPARLSR